MRTHFFLTLGMAAVLVPCALPPSAGAQAPATVRLAMTPPQFQIGADYVTTTPANFDKEQKRIAPGKAHDALLLAALLKDGAQHTQSPQITTPAGVPGSYGYVSQTLPALTSSIEATPRINKNGSIAVDITLRQDVLSSDAPPGAILPAVNTTGVTQTATFADGQTLMIAGMNNGSGNVCLIFAHVKSAAK